nr:MAG TPA: Tryparedoxin peroxidase [Caudoviricetes sp.]
MLRGLVLYGSVYSVILMGSSHHGYAVFFLHELWYNIYR